MIGTTQNNSDSDSDEAKNDVIHNAAQGRTSREGVIDWELPPPIIMDHHSEIPSDSEEGHDDDGYDYHHHDATTTTRPAVKRIQSLPAPKTTTTTVKKERPSLASYLESPAYTDSMRSIMTPGDSSRPSLAAYLGSGSTRTAFANSNNNSMLFSPTKEGHTSRPSLSAFLSSPSPADTSMRSLDVGTTASVAATMQEKLAETRELHQSTLRKLQQERMDRRKDQREIQHLKLLLQQHQEAAQQQNQQQMASVVVDDGDDDGDDDDAARTVPLLRQEMKILKEKYDQLVEEQANHEAEQEACVDQLLTMRRDLITTQQDNAQLKRDLLALKQQKNSQQNQDSVIADLEEELDKWQTLFFETMELGTSKIGTLEQELEDLAENSKTSSTIKKKAMAASKMLREQEEQQLSSSNLSNNSASDINHHEYSDYHLSTSELRSELARASLQEEGEDEDEDEEEDRKELQRALEASEYRCVVLQDDLEKAYRQIQSTRKELVASQAQISLLEQQLQQQTEDERTNHATSLHSMPVAVNAEDQEQKLEKMRADKEQLSKQVEQERSEKQRQEADLKDELRQEREKTKAAQEELLVAKEQVSKLQNDLKELEKEAQEKERAAVGESKQENDDDDNDMLPLIILLEEANATLGQTTQDLNTQRQRVQQLEEELEREKKHSKENADWKEQLEKDSEDKVNEAKQELQSTRDQLTTLQAAHEELKKENEDINLVRAEEVERLQNMESKQTETLSKLQESQKEVESKTNQLNELQEKLDDAISTMNQLKLENEELKVEVVNSSSKPDDMLPLIVLLDETSSKLEETSQKLFYQQRLVQNLELQLGAEKESRNKEIDALDQEIEQLKMDSNAKEDMLTSLRETSNEQDMKEENQNLRAYVELLKAKEKIFLEMKDIYDLQKLMSDSNQADWDALQAQIAEEKKNAKESKKLVEDFEDQLEDQEEKMDALHAGTEEVASLVAKLSISEEQRAAQEGELESLKLSNDEISTRLDGLNKMRATFDQTLELVQSENRQLQDERDALENEKTELMDKILSLESELESQKNSHADALKASQGEIEEMLASLRESTSKLETLQEEGERLKDYVRLFESKEQIYKEMLEVKQVQELQSVSQPPDLKVLQAQLARERERGEEAEEIIETLTDKLEAQEEKLASITAEVALIHVAKADLSNAGEKLMAQERELEDLKASSNDIITQLNAEVDTLRATLDEKDETLEDLETRSSQLQQDREALESDKRGLQEKIESLESHVEDLRASHAEALEGSAAEIAGMLASLNETTSRLETMRLDGESLREYVQLFESKEQIYKEMLQTHEAQRLHSISAKPDLDELEARLAGEKAKREQSEDLVMSLKERLESQEERLSSFTDKIRKLDSTGFSAALEQLSGQERELEELKISNEGISTFLNTELEALRTSLDEKTRALDFAQVECNELQRDREKIKKEQAELQNKIASLESQLENDSNEQIELHSVHSELSQERRKSEISRNLITVMKKQLSEKDVLESKLAAEQKRVASMTKDLNNANETLVEMEKKLEEKERLQSEKRAEERKIEDQEVGHHQFGEKDALDSKLAAEQERVASMMADLNVMKNQLREKDALERKLAAEQERVVSMTKDLDILRKQLSEKDVLESKLAAEQERVASMMEDLKCANEVLAEMEQRLGAKESSQTPINEEKAEERKMEEVKSGNQQLSEKDALERKLAAEQERVASMMEDLHYANEILSEMEKRLEEKESSQTSISEEKAEERKIEQGGHPISDPVKSMEGATNGVAGEPGSVSRGPEKTDSSAQDLASRVSKASADTNEALEWCNSIEELQFDTGNIDRLKQDLDNQLKAMSWSDHSATNGDVEAGPK